MADISKRHKKGRVVDSESDKENQSPIRDPVPMPSWLSESSTMLSTFRCHVKKGSLVLNQDTGPTFGMYSIIVEQILDHRAINKDDTSDLDASLPEPDTAISEVEEEDSDNINLDSDTDTHIALIGLPFPGPLQGYGYIPFVPKNEPRVLPGHKAISPTLHDAIAVLADLQSIVRPRCNKGASYKDPDLDIWTRAWLEGMLSMLRMYTNPESGTYNAWEVSGYQAAIGMGWGCHCGRRLRELCQVFLADQIVLPINPYGDWNESLLVDEQLCNEINIFLMSIGNEISGKKLMDFLHRSDIKEKFGIDRNISICTARRYLNALRFHYRTTPKGQYVDSHERADVVYYRDNVFLLQWCWIQEQMAAWDERVKLHKYYRD